MDIRPPAFRPILPYQQDGVDFITAIPRAGLHDVMGLGKTAQMIRAADKIKATRGVIIVPAKLRRNTVKQFGIWATRGYKVTEGRELADFLAWQRGRYHLLITSYEQATKWAKSIYATGEPIDFVAMDEAHAVKNIDAARTRAILGEKLDGRGGLINWAEHVWHISGTPMANDPLDIYTFLRMTGKTTMEVGAFIRKYFYSDAGAYSSRQTVRPQMLHELTMLINSVRIRRTLKDVGIQLPPLRLDPLVVDGDTTHVANLLRQHPGLSQSIINAINGGGLSFIDAPHIMTLRRLLGEAKAVPYAHILYNDIMTTGEKHVVMGFHVAALQFVFDFLMKRGIRCVLVNGTISDRQAYKAVEQFQNDPGTIGFIGNIQSAGMGNDLFASYRLDMLESDWTPKGNAQAVKRIHRIGQTNPCFVRFVSLARTFDENVNELVIDKTSAIADIEGDRMPAHA